MPPSNPNIKPPLGQVQFGDLYRQAPISNKFGFDRGTPIDRYYIETFLQRNAGDISGRVLEVGDDSYSRRFGGDRVVHQDVLHVRAGNPGATLVGDLSEAGVIPSNTFDCIVLTQTLHLIFDLAAAMRNLFDALRQNGRLLVTVPGISQIDRGEWRESWYWSLTSCSAQKLFGSVFAPQSLDIVQYGNVFAAISFLHGLAVEEVSTSDLDAFDPAYPVIIAVRAQKRG